YLTSDAGLLSGFIGQTLAQLNNDLNGSNPSFCGELSNDCFLVQINEDSPPVTIDTAVCQGQCVVINGVSYCASGSTQIIFPNAANCDSTVNLNLEVLNTTALIAPAAQLDCTNSTVLLDGSGSSSGANVSYLWTGPPGCILSNPTNSSIQVNCAGSYTLAVTETGLGGNSCVVSSSVTVVQDIMPPIATASGAVLTCLQTQVLLDGTGSSTGANFSYQWTTADGNILSGATTLQPTVDQPGTYTFTVTNTTNGCVSSTAVLVLEDTTAPTASASGGTLTCTQTQVVLNGIGSSVGPNFTYQWTTAGGNIASGATTLNPAVDQAGTYTLTVTNTSNGCTAMVSVTVTADQAAPVADAGPTGILTCSQPTLMLDGSGSDSGAGISYQWTTSDGNILSGATTTQPTVNAPGTYILTVTNSSNGCTATASVTITADTAAPIAAGVGGFITC
ncbi:MAG: PKD domain-containing protein, partial [Phaeodactylibacter sp.]|nr:PKD domain-containing protein [Phaeodactylibacter sp.]